MSSTRSARPTGRQGGARNSASPAVPATVLSRPAGWPDFLYLTVLAALISFGVVMFYGTTAIHGDPLDLVKLGVGLVAGTFLLWVFARVPLPTLRRWGPILLLICVGALLSLKIDGAPWAVTTNGATRWIRLPGGFTIQPSEFTKLAFVLVSAHLLDRWGRRMNANGLREWAVFGGILVVLAGLIYKEPDLGTALVLTGTAFCMMIAAGIDLKKLFGLTILLGAVVLLLAWNTGHQRARLESWWNPWAEEHRQDSGYQIIRSWVAMARGGLMGVGLGQSTMKLDNRLPESETDFIFAIVAEELGLLRAAGVLVLFGILSWRGFSIAARAPDRYSSLVVSGIASWIAVQSCLNIAVATGTVPNTGVPLPFISSGLSSLTALMAGAGLVTGVSMRLLPAKKTR